MYTMSGEQLDYRLVSEEGGGGRSVERDAEGRGNRGREQRTSADVEGRYRLYRQSHIAIPGIDTTPSSYVGDGEKHRAQVSTGHGYNNDTNRDMHVHSHPPYCLLVPPIPLPYLSHTSPMSGTKSSKPRRKARGKRSNATRTALALPNPMRGVILVYQPCAPRLPLPHQPHQQPRLHHRGR